MLSNGHGRSHRKKLRLRKVWVQDELNRLAAYFGIDLICFSVMSNHFHMVLRSRPDVVKQWSDTEVARRWLMLCPVRKNANRQAEEPNEFELNMIRNNKPFLTSIRRRLSDISWWVRLISQNIAQRANKDDKEVGKFWQARFKAVRLLDEVSLLACAAYVDLNPIRAAMAQTLEASKHTSIQLRIQSVQEKVSSAKPKPSSKVRQKRASHTRPDAFLSPVQINERTDPIGAHLSRNGKRASDKGFLPISAAAYIELLDWTARQIKRDKVGRTPANAAPIFERLGISGATWCELVRDFGKLFSVMAGKPHVIDSRRTQNGMRRFNAKPRTRELLKC